MATGCAGTVIGTAL
jgi:hypothetical protein